MHSSPSDHVANQVRKLRQNLGINRTELADLCARVGMPQLTAAAITNIETGRPDKETGKRRRDITLEELLCLALVLGIHPVDLMVPNDLADFAEYRITPEMPLAAGDMREWIRGEWFMKDPADPAELAKAIRWMPLERAKATSIRFISLLHTKTE